MHLYFRVDEYWIKKKGQGTLFFFFHNDNKPRGFSPKDRPKRWKNECFDTIKQLFETKYNNYLNYIYKYF